MEVGGSRVDNRIRKMLLERRGKINCAICKYNRGENAKRKEKANKYKNINRQSIRYIWIDEVPEIIEDTGGGKLI